MPSLLPPLTALSNRINLPTTVQYAMPTDNFKDRYVFDNPLPTEDGMMAAEGFDRYQPTGKIWGHVVTKEEMDSYFKV